MAVLDTVTGADVKVYSQAGPSSYAAGGFLLDASADFSWLGMLDVTVYSPAVLNLDGLNSWASTPDNPALDIVGDITITALLALADWTPVLTAAYLVSKMQLFVSQSYIFLVDQTTGTLTFLYSSDGTNFLGATSSVAPTIANGAFLNIKVTRNATTGDVKFYTKAYDPTINPRTQNIDPTGYVQLGSTQSTAAGGMFSSAVEVRIGAEISLATTATGLQASKYLAVSIQNGIDTGIVADPDFSIQTPGDDSFTDAAGRVWTCDENAFVDSQLGGYDIEQDINVDLAGAEAFGKGVVKVVSQRYNKATVGNVNGQPGGVTVESAAGLHAVADAHVHTINHDHAAVTSAAPTAGGGAVNLGAGNLTLHTHNFDVPSFTGNTGLGGHNHQFSFEYDHDHPINAPTVTDVAATEMTTGTDLRATTFLVTAYGFGKT